MPARPGAFTANFAPETLNKFRDTCKRRGLQYTKVLEELAGIFLESDGLVLNYKLLELNNQKSFDREKKNIKGIIEILESKNLLDVETRNKIGEIIAKNGAPTPEDAVAQTHVYREVRERQERMEDSSIDRTAPPEHLTKWEEGYSDLFEKLAQSDRGIRADLRLLKGTSSKEINILKRKVFRLEEQLSELQSKVTD